MKEVTNLKKKKFGKEPVNIVHYGYVPETFYIN